MTEGKPHDDLLAEVAMAQRRLAELEAQLKPGRVKRRISRAQLELALETAGAGTWEWDLQTNQVWWSDSVEQLFGLEPGEFDGTYAGYLGLLSDADRQRVQDEVTATLKAGGSYRVEHQLNTPSGTRWLASRGQLFRDSNGNPTRMTGMVGDITARKLFEVQLRESEQRFRAFAEASFEGIAFSAQGVVIDCNDAICEICGYEPGGLVGVRVADLVAPEDAPLVREHMQTGYPGAYQHRVIRRDGSMVHVEVRGRMVDYLGQTARITAVRDITEQKRLEQEREQLEQQLYQAQKMEAVGQLAGGIAHDFNNILSVILGNLELARADLEQGAKPESVLDLLEEATESAHKAATVTAQLLAFSRRQPNRPRPVNLNAVVRDMQGMLHRVIYENIQLTLNLEQELGTVLVDPGQMQQVLMNLVVNARDAMPDGGEITVSTHNLAVSGIPDHDGPAVSLRVADSGCGMTPEMVVHIFEPFYTTKPIGRGTGLGLSVAYGIIEQAGGHVSVQTEPRRGTTFDIRLPRQDLRPESLPAERQPSAVPGGPEVILVCEDDRNVRTLIQRILADVGYTVLEAPNAERALELAGQTPAVHLLITDVILPGLDGKQLSMELARRHPGARTLFCSGYTSNVITDRGVMEAGVEFLPKPFSRVGLLNQVRALLDERG